MPNKMNAHIHAMREMTTVMVTIVRLCPTENAPCGTSFPAAFEFSGISENRVEEVAAVATQAVINPTPVMTCPATKAGVEAALLKKHMPQITVIAAARYPIIGKAYLAVRL